MDDLSAVRRILGGTDPSPDSTMRGRLRLHHAMTRERQPARRPRIIRRTALSLSVAAAAAVAVAVSSSTAPPAQPVRPSAHQVLLAAAASVARQPSEGNWWGNKLIKGTRMRDPGDRYTLQVTAAEETWIPTAPETPHWIVERYLGARPATPQDEAIWQAEGSPTTWTYRHSPPKAWNPFVLPSPPDRISALPDAARSFESTDINWRLMLAGKPLARMDDLPIDEDKLLALVSPKNGTRQDLIGNLANLIFYAPVPSQVRAAAYRLMAGLPEVTAEGSVTDQLGRTGHAVIYQQADPLRQGQQVLERLVVDPVTGEPLALETLAPDTRELRSFVAVQDALWTDSLPDLPDPVLSKTADKKPLS